MKREHFLETLRKIYASHGKAAPTSADMVDSIWERVKDLPDAFMDFALEKLRDEEKLPGNTGLAMRRLWLEYLDRNPARRAREENRGCDNCRGLPGSLPGLFFIYDPVDGHRYVVKCVCDATPGLSHMPGWTRNFALERGYLLRDPNDPPEEVAPCPRAAPVALSFTGE